MMKYLLLLAVLVMASFPVRADEPVFIDTLGDVPLAANLSELPERAVLFDKPDGRIASAVAMLAPGQNPQKVEDFYHATLPQMGWKRASSGSSVWRRDAQTLSIQRGVENGVVLFLFSLEPV